MELFDDDSNNISISVNKNDEDKQNIEKQSIMIYENVLDSFHKKQFKKTITYIESNEKKVISIHYWRILIIKLSCYQEIIEKKISRYYNKPNLTSITRYFSLFNKNTTKFFIELRDNDETSEYYLNKCECILTLVLRQCYNYAQFCIHQKLLYDCIGFLSLGERLIRNSSHFFLSPETDYYASCIFLFLSSLFIISDNFGTAKKYIVISLKLCYKELELRLDNDNIFSLINLNDYTENDQEKFNKIFFNIAICFYHLGICYEHEYEFNEAYQAYKQAKWFSHSIPNEDLIQFSISMYNMEKREGLRLKLINFFREEEKEVQVEKKQKKQKPKVWFDEETNIKKYEKLEEYLTKMKLTEVDDDDPDLLNTVHGKPFSKNVGIPTKTIHVLNYLMDEKFREVIEKMKKLEINCLNKNTKETIQKQILNIKNEERVKDAEKTKEKENKKLKEEENKILKKEENKILKEEENKILKEENNKILKEEENKKIKEEKTKVDNLKKKNIMKLKNKKIGKHSKYQITLNPNLVSNNSKVNSKRYSSIFSEKSKDEISVRSNIQTSYNNFTKNVFLLKTSINCSKGNKTFHKEKNEKEIQKISCDHYVFNKSFKEKKKYLDEQFNRELKFQKNLLKSKGGGSQDFDFIYFDERKTKAQCEDFFEKALENEIKLGIEKDIKKEEQKKISQLERVSLNTFRFPIKLLGKLSKKPKKEFKPEVENRKYIDQLTSQIEVIDNTKKYILKSYKRNLKKNI